MNDTVPVALIGAIGLVIVAIVPFLTAYMTSRFAQAGKREDWARQDAVAAKAEKAAALLLADNKKLARATKLVKERQAKYARETGNQLSEVHTLVNSQFTAAIRSELAGTKRERVLLMEAIEAKSHNGNGKPSEETLEALESAKARIDELEETLKDRERQTKLAEKQADKKIGKSTEKQTA